MAGLSGTGLGGIFYILLVVWAIIRQSVQHGTVCGLEAGATARYNGGSDHPRALGRGVGYRQFSRRMPKSATLCRLPHPRRTCGTVLALTPVLWLAMLLCALRITQSLLVPRETVSPR